MLQTIGQYIITPIFNTPLFIGITFGQLVVAVFGLPIVVKAFKALIGVAK